MSYKVLIPIDGSPCSLRAAELAAKWASQMGWSATLFHIYSAKSKNSSNGDSGEIFEGPESFFKRKGLQVRRREAKGDPAQEICEVVKAGKYDLVIMGSRGLSGLKKLFMGSVSSKVIMSATCPVTIVH